MARTLLVLALVVAPAVARADHGPSDSPRDRSFAFWYAALPTVVGFGVSNFPDAGTVEIPIGVAIGLGAVADLGIDLTAHVHWARTPVSHEANRGGFLGIGPMFHAGGARLNGFFFQPKLVLGLFHHDPAVIDNGDPAMLATSPEGIQFDGMGGFNLGFHQAFGPLYVQVAIGASLGFSVGSRSLPLAGTWYALVKTPSTGFIVGFDLAAVRLGFAI